VAKITFGDLAIGGVLTMIISWVIYIATYVVMSALPSSAVDINIETILGVLVSFYLVGSVVLCVRIRNAGYPVVRTWATGSLVILLLHGFPIALCFAEGTPEALRLVGWFLVEAFIFSCAMLFVVALASTLSQRMVGLPQQRFPRFYGSAPSQSGASIYKSGQPVVYEGIEGLDLSERAPGSLYRRKQ